MENRGISKMANGIDVPFDNLACGTQRWIAFVAIIPFCMVLHVKAAPTSQHKKQKNDKRSDFMLNITVL